MTDFTIIGKNVKTKNERKKIQIPDEGSDLPLVCFWLAW